ncbi:MAG: prolipoprotein diacylglyceryl transferase family protein [Candidatus Udaeobacter sp.]
MISCKPFGFPRVIPFGERSVSTFKLCLVAGIYFGTLTCAAVAERNGIDPIPMALATVGCAMAGLIGSRHFHLMLFARRYRGGGFFQSAWNTSLGGAGLFGGLVVIVLLSPLAARILRLPFGMFWDYLLISMVVGALWTRLGCFCNGCCGGRETSKPFAFRWHNHRGERKKRIPVQLLEIGWIALAGGMLIYLFDKPHAAGALALGGFAWYGAGRFFLEPLREEPDIAFSIRVNRLIAVIVSLIAASWLLILQCSRY